MFVFQKESIAIPALIILWNLVGHWRCTQQEMKKRMCLDMLCFKEQKLGENIC